MPDLETTQALGRITEKLGEIQTTQVEHGLTLATLEERSQQQESRMNRTDKKTMLSGGGAGGAIAGVLIALKFWFTGS